MSGPGLYLALITETMRVKLFEGGGIMSFKEDYFS